MRMHLSWGTAPCRGSGRPLSRARWLPGSATVFSRMKSSMLRMCSFAVVALVLLCGLLLPDDSTPRRSDHLEAQGRARAEAVPNLMAVLRKRGRSECCGTGLRSK